MNIRWRGNPYSAIKRNPAMTTEQRFERLERQNRNLRRSVIGMAVAGLSVLVMGQTLPPKVHDVVRGKALAKFE